MYISVFRIMALTLVGAQGYTTVWTNAKILIMFILPFIGKSLGWCVMLCYADMIKRSYEQRKESKVKSKDFIDLMVDELQKSEQTLPGKTYGGDFEKGSALNTTTTGLTSLRESGKDDVTLIIANILVFFFAGFETTSTGFTILFHKLAIFPEYQEKVLNEIDEIIGDSEDITYDKIQSHFIGTVKI